MFGAARRTTRYQRENKENLPRRTRLTLDKNFNSNGLCEDLKCYCAAEQEGDREICLA